MDLKDVKNLLTINKSVLKLLMMRQMDEANTRDCNISGRHYFCPAVILFTIS